MLVEAMDEPSRMPLRIWLVESLLADTRTLGWSMSALGLGEDSTGGGRVIGTRRGLPPSWGDSDSGADVVVVVVVIIHGGNGRWVVVGFRVVDTARKKTRH